MGIVQQEIEFSGVCLYVLIGVDFIFRDSRQNVVVEYEGAVDGGGRTGGQFVRECAQISAGLRFVFRELGVYLQGGGYIIIPKTAENVAGNDGIV